MSSASQSLTCPAIQRHGRALYYERDFLHILDNGVYANSILFKHASYRHEEEYRLLVSGFRTSISACGHHHLRERNGEIVGYLSLPIPELERERGAFSYPSRSGGAWSAGGSTAHGAYDAGVYPDQRTSTSHASRIVQHAEPDPAEMAVRYGADTSVLDWRERLVCSKCGGRQADMVVTGTQRSAGRTASV